MVCVVKHSKPLARSLHTAHDQHRIHTSKVSATTSVYDDFRNLVDLALEKCI